MIYEQRKTNQILVAGFTNLADALNDMTWRITDSIDNLASSVDGMTSTLNESMQAIHSRMGDIHEELSKEASERAVREKKALEMLDNIQRRRKPSLLEGPHP
jgi:DNA anti-recombination protein RmuC